MSEEIEKQKIEDNELLNEEEALPEITEDEKQPIDNNDPYKEEKEKFLNSLIDLNEEGLKEKLDIIYKDINPIRKEKNEFFTELKELKNEIRSLKKENKEKVIINKKLQKENKEIKVKLDPIKEEFDKFNKDFQVLKDSNKELFKPTKEKVNFNQIKHQIEELEYTIETSGMSFKKEQKVQEEINTLKKKTAVFDSNKDFFEKYNALNNNLRKIRKDMITYNKAIYENYKIINKNVTLIKKNSKFINDKEVIEKEREVKFKEILDRFNLINFKKETLLGRLKKSDELSEKMKKEIQKERIKEQYKEVNDKIKKRAKITTEDLFIFQSQNKKSR